MIHQDESPPLPNRRVLCRHPFQETKRAYVEPARVEPLLKEFWRDGRRVVQTGDSAASASASASATSVTASKDVIKEIKEIRNRAMEQIKVLRDDHKRDLNPTPYKVSISDRLYTELHTLWLDNAPIGELS